MITSRPLQLVYKKNLSANLQNEIQQVNREWRQNMEFWKLEFEALQRLFELRSSKRPAQVSVVDNRFYHLEELMQEEYPKFREALQLFDAQLEKENYSSMQLTHRINILKQLLAEFESKFNERKIEFINTFCEVIPVVIV